MTKPHTNKLRIYPQEIRIKEMSLGRKSVGDLKNLYCANVLCHNDIGTPQKCEH